MLAGPVSDPAGKKGGEGATRVLTAREYIEAVAHELGKLRGRGLLLSPADAPLAAVIAQVRKAARLKARGAHVRGAADPGISLQAIAQSFEATVKRARGRKPAEKPQGL